ncbi:acyl-CoA thioester hydrolase/BAAT C-terminal domain-containing protein [Virgibacillus oceani]
MFNQKALPNVKFKYRPLTMFSILKNWILRKSISYLSIWDKTLKGQKGITEASIPVENINVPIMLITGKDDQLWPSDQFVKMMEIKLKDAKGSDYNRYLYYENAGHFLSFPYSFVNLPANIHMNTGGGMTVTFGGSKRANAKAAKDSWSQILEFLYENMGHSTIVRNK